MRRRAPTPPPPRRGPRQGWCASDRWRCGGSGERKTSRERANDQVPQTKIPWILVSGAWSLISSRHQDPTIHLVPHRKSFGEDGAVSDDDENRVLRLVQ